MLALSVWIVAMSTGYTRVRQDGMHVGRGSDKGASDRVVRTSASSESRVVPAGETATEVPSVRAEFVESLQRLPPIPHKIHIFWPSAKVVDSNDELVRHGIRQLIDLNPQWTWKVYEHDDIDAVIRAEPSRSDPLLSDKDVQILLKAHIVERTDAARMLIMWREGGFYQDVDRVYNVPMSEVLEQGVKMVLTTLYDTNWMQDLLCSAPGNPIFRRTILDVRELRRSAPRVNGTASLLRHMEMVEAYTRAVNLELFGRIDIPRKEARAAIASVPGLLAFREEWCDGPWVRPFDTCKSISRSALYESYGIVPWSTQVKAQWTSICNALRLVDDTASVASVLAQYDCSHPDHIGTGTVQKRAQPLHTETPKPTQLARSAAEMEAELNVDPTLLAALDALPPIPHKMHVFFPTHALVDSKDPMVIHGVRKMIDLNPDWTLTIYDHAAVDDYIRKELTRTDPQLSRRDVELALNAHFVERTDVARLLIMWHEGGFYQDVDRIYNVPMSEVVTSDKIKMVLPTMYDSTFMMDLMCTAPHNPIVQRALDMAWDLRRVAPRVGGWSSFHDEMAIADSWTTAVSLELFGRRHVDLAEARAAIGKVTQIKTYKEEWCDGLWVRPFDGCKSITRENLYADFNITKWAPQVQRRWQDHCTVIATRLEKGHVTIASITPDATKTTKRRRLKSRALERLANDFEKYQCAFPEHRINNAK